MGSHAAPWRTRRRGWRFVLSSAMIGSPWIPEPTRSLPERCPFLHGGGAPSHGLGGDQFPLDRREGIVTTLGAFVDPPYQRHAQARCENIEHAQQARDRFHGEGRIGERGERRCAECHAPFQRGCAICSTLARSVMVSSPFDSFNSPALRNSVITRLT